MRDPDLVTRAERAAVALERAWERWRAMHGLSAEPMPPVSSYVGYSIEEPWGRPRVVFGIDAREAELLAALLDHHECVGPFYRSDAGETGFGADPAGSAGTRLDEARSRIPAQAQAAGERARQEEWAGYQEQPRQQWDRDLPPGPVDRPGTDGDLHAGQADFGDGAPAAREETREATDGPPRQVEDRGGAARASDQHHDRRAETARPSRRERRAASRQRSAVAREQSAEMNRTDVTEHAAASPPNREAGNQAGRASGGPTGYASGGTEHVPGGAERIPGSVEHLASGAEQVLEGTEQASDGIEHALAAAEHLAAGAEHVPGEVEHISVGAERMPGGAENVSGGLGRAWEDVEHAAEGAEPGWPAGAEGTTLADESATAGQPGRPGRAASSAAVEITTVDSIPVDRGSVEREPMEHGPIEHGPADRDAVDQGAGESAAGDSALGGGPARRSAADPDPASQAPARDADQRSEGSAARDCTAGNSAPAGDAASHAPGRESADRSVTDRAVVDAERAPRGRSLYDVTKARWERAREAARGRGGALGEARGSAGETVRSAQTSGGPVSPTGLGGPGQPDRRADGGPAASEPADAEHAGHDPAVFGAGDPAGASEHRAGGHDADDHVPGYASEHGSGDHPRAGHDYPALPSSGFERGADGQNDADDHWQDTGPGPGYTGDPALDHAADAAQDYPGDNGWDDVPGHDEHPVTRNGDLPGPGGTGGRDPGRSDTAGLDQLWGIGRSGAVRGQGQPGTAGGGDAVRVDPPGNSTPGNAAIGDAPGNSVLGNVPGDSARGGHGPGTTAGSGRGTDARGSLDRGAARDASLGTARGSVWAQDGGSAWETSPARDGRDGQPADFDPDPLAVPADRGAPFLAAPPPSGTILTTAPRQETRTARPSAGSMATETIAAELAGWAAGELPGQASARLAAWAAIGGVPAPGNHRTDGSDVGAAGVGTEPVR